MALNGSGRAPAAASLDWYLERGFREIPEQSPHAVTVPGAVDAWFRLLADHGTREMGELLQPAIRLAEEGCQVAPRVAYDLAEACARVANDPTAAKVFLRKGVPVGLGEQIRQPQLAATLRRIAEEGRRGFYEGPVAEDMVRRLRALGGCTRQRTSLRSDQFMKRLYLPPTPIMRSTNARPTARALLH